MFGCILANVQVWLELHTGYARYNQVRVRAGHVFLVFRGVFANLRVRRNQKTFEVSVHHERCLDLFFDVTKFDNGISWKGCFLSTMSVALELVFIAPPLGIL